MHQDGPKTPAGVSDSVASKGNVAPASPKMAITSFSAQPPQTMGSVWMVDIKKKLQKEAVESYARRKAMPGYRVAGTVHGILRKVAARPTWAEDVAMPLVDTTVHRCQTVNVPNDALSYLPTGIDYSLYDAEEPLPQPLERIKAIATRNRSLLTKTDLVGIQNDGTVNEAALVADAVRVAMDAVIEDVRRILDEYVPPVLIPKSRSPSPNDVHQPNPATRDDCRPSKNRFQQSTNKQKEQQNINFNGVEHLANAVFGDVQRELLLRFVSSHPEEAVQVATQATQAVRRERRRQLRLRRGQNAHTHIHFSDLITAKYTSRNARTSAHSEEDDEDDRRRSVSSIGSRRSVSNPNFINSAPPAVATNLLPGQPNVGVYTAGATFPQALLHAARDDVNRARTGHIGYLLRGERNERPPEPHIAIPPLTVRFWETSSGRVYLESYEKQYGVNLADTIAVGRGNMSLANGDKSLKLAESLPPPLMTLPALDALKANLSENGNSRCHEPIVTITDPQIEIHAGSLSPSPAPNYPSSFLKNAATTYNNDNTLPSIDKYSHAKFMNILSNAILTQERQIAGEIDLFGFDDALIEQPIAGKRKPKNDFETNLKSPQESALDSSLRADQDSQPLPLLCLFDPEEPFVPPWRRPQHIQGAIDIAKGKSTSSWETSSALLPPIESNVSSIEPSGRMSVEGPRANSKFRQLSKSKKHLFNSMNHSTKADDINDEWFLAHPSLDELKLLHELANSEAPTVVNVLTGQSGSSQDPDMIPSGLHSSNFQRNSDFVITASKAMRRAVFDVFEEVSKYATASVPTTANTASVPSGGSIFARSLKGTVSGQMCSQSSGSKSGTLVGDPVTDASIPSMTTGDILFGRTVTMARCQTESDLSLPDSSSHARTGKEGDAVQATEETDQDAFFDALPEIPLQQRQEAKLLYELVYNDVTRRAHHFEEELMRGTVAIESASAAASAATSSFARSRSVTISDAASLPLVASALAGTLPHGAGGGLPEDFVPTCVICWAQHHTERPLRPLTMLSMQRAAERERERSAKERAIRQKQRGASSVVLLEGLNDSQQPKPHGGTRLTAHRMRELIRLNRVHKQLLRSAAIAGDAIRHWRAMHAESDLLQQRALQMALRGRATASSELNRHASQLADLITGVERRAYEWNLKRGGNGDAAGRVPKKRVESSRSPSPSGASPPSESPQTDELEDDELFVEPSGPVLESLWAAPERVMRHRRQQWYYCQLQWDRVTEVLALLHYPRTAAEALVIRELRDILVESRLVRRSHFFLWLRRVQRLWERGLLMETTNAIGSRNGGSTSPVDSSGMAPPKQNFGAALCSDRRWLRLIIAMRFLFGISRAVLERWCRLSPQRHAGWKLPASDSSI